MRVLRTMNSVSEIRREDLIGLNIKDLQSHHRRSHRTLDKVCVELSLMLCTFEKKKRRTYHL